MPYKWPEDPKCKFTTVPLIKECKGKNVTFIDGSVHHVDTIIMCTGYVHKFPFIEDDLRLECQNRLWIQDLWKGVVWNKNPNLLYLGMQN